MKRVWILERFVGRDEMIKAHDFMKTMLDNMKDSSAIDDESVKMFEQSVVNFEKMMSDNPDGYWKGVEGKETNVEFHFVAKATLRKNQADKFRVIEAAIPDDAKFWVGYKPIRENKVFLQYVRAEILGEKF